MISKKTRCKGLFGFALVCLFPWLLQAQAQEPAAQEPPSEAVASDADRLSALEKKLQEQQETIQEQQDTIHNQQQQLSDLEQKDTVIQEQVDGLHVPSAVSEEQILAEMAATSSDVYTTDKLLDVYGFFSGTFMKSFYRDQSPYEVYIPSNNTFVASDLNLYFSSQLSQTLSALAELRISVKPHGEEATLGSIVRIGETESVVGEYERVDTGVKNAVDPGYFRPGSVSIERVRLLYAPFDGLKFMVGRYLTPYGIWNVDHGAPVILPVRVPYMQSREMVPQAQTGVQVLGRAFLRYDIFFDYAVTLSNGRGPLDQVFDLDKNKAVGAKLKVSWEGENWTLAGGVYGYYGKYTDVKKSLVLYMKRDMTLDDTVEMPMRTRVEKTSAYDETIVTADLLVEGYNVGVQAEYVWRYVDYSVPAFRTAQEQMFSGAAVGANLFDANNQSNGYYILAYWHLPLSKWLGSVRITPFFMYEFNQSNDTTPFTNFEFYSAGLNVKPMPYVTLKGEWSCGIPESKLYGGNINTLVAQVAVSF